MTTDEQKEFIQGLSKSIVDSISQQIDDGKIPETWDGHELRCLLSYRHAESAEISLIVKEPKSKRAKQYKNTIITSTL